MATALLAAAALATLPRSPARPVRCVYIPQQSSVIRPRILRGHVLLAQGCRGASQASHVDDPAGLKRVQRLHAQLVAAQFSPPGLGACACGPSPNPALAPLGALGVPLLAPLPLPVAQRSPSSAAPCACGWSMSVNASGSVSVSELSSAGAAAGARAVGRVAMGLEQQPAPVALSGGASRPGPERARADAS